MDKENVPPTSAKFASTFIWILNRIEIVPIQNVLNFKGLDSDRGCTTAYWIKLDNSVIEKGCVLKIAGKANIIFQYMFVLKTINIKYDFNQVASINVITFQRVGCEAICENLVLEVHNVYQQKIIFFEMSLLKNYFKAIKNNNKDNNNKIIKNSFNTQP